MTVNPATQAREHVAATLRALDLQVHPEPPESITGVCVVCSPGSPWLTRRGLSGAWEVIVDVTVLVPVAGGRTMLARLEETVGMVLRVSVLRRPPGDPEVMTVTRQTLGTGEFYAAVIRTLVHVDEEE